MEKPRIYWHPACVNPYLDLIDYTRHGTALAIRQNWLCACGCGQVVGGIKFGPTFDDPEHVQDMRRRNPDLDLPEHPYTPAYCYWTGEVDHRIPLWKTQGMPDAQRLWYFGIENLQLLTVACHARKTGAEAAERAKVKRLAGEGRKPRVGSAAANRGLPF